MSLQRAQLGSAASQATLHESFKQRQQEGNKHRADTSPSQRLSKSPCLPSSPSRKAQEVGPCSGLGHPRAKASKDSNRVKHNSATAIKAEVQGLVQDSEVAKEEPLPAQGPPPNSPAAPNPPTRSHAAPPTLQAADAALKSDAKYAKVEAQGSGEASLSGLGRVVAAQGCPGNNASERQCDSNAAHQQMLKAAAEQVPPASMPRPREEGSPEQPAGQLDTIKRSCPVEESIQPQTGLLGREGGGQQAAFSPSADADAGLLPDSKVTTMQNVEVQRPRTIESDSTLQTAAVGAPAESSPGTPGLERREGSLGEKPSTEAADSVCELEIDLSLGFSPPGVPNSTGSLRPSQILPTARPTDPGISASVPYLNPQSLPDQAAMAEPEPRQRGVDELDSSEATRSVELHPRGQPQHQTQSNSDNKDAASSESCDKNPRNRDHGGKHLKDAGKQQQGQCGLGGQLGASCASGLPASMAKPLTVHCQPAEPAMEAEVPRALFSCFDLLAELPASVDPGAASQGMLQLSAMHNCLKPGDLNLVYR